MLRINAALLALVFTLSSIACASQPNANEKIFLVNQYSVEARIFFRAWNTKEFGEPIGAASFSVIASPDERGDIVVLRKNEASGGFTAEVYRPDADIEKPASGWQGSMRPLWIARSWVTCPAGRCRPPIMPGWPRRSALWTSTWGPVAAMAVSSTSFSSREMVGCAGPPLCFGSRSSSSRRVGSASARNAESTSGIEIVIVFAYVSQSLQA